MRESVTFIHAADVHLDAPFQGVSSSEQSVGRALADATYEAWRRVVDLAIRHPVDFVVVAGDVYNSGDRSLRAQISFREQAQRLHDAGIPLFVAHGNHDPLDGWSAGLTMPDNVHVFPGGEVGRVLAISEGDFTCSVYGRSYETKAELTDFTPGYIRDASDTLAIGVLHANVGSAADYEPYAPCTVEALRSCGMDYWALGHIHKHDVLCTEPYAVQAGSPQGLNPKETGAHGCCLVTVRAGGEVSLQHVDVAPVAWAQETVDVSGAATLDEFTAEISSVLDQVRQASSRDTIVRLEVIGRSPIHPVLIRPGVLDDLVESLRADALASSPWVWIDGVTDRTAAVIDLEKLRQSPDFVGDLVRIADGLLGDEDSALAEVQAAASGLRKGSAESVDLLGVRQIIEQARDRVLDLLVPAEGES